MTLSSLKTEPGQQVVGRRRVLLIAWPIIISNLSTPLLGAVDTAVIGNLGNPALIGAIALGSLIFSFIFWGFSFLRMGTTGLIAQSAAAGDHIEVKSIIYRALLLALSIGTLITLLQLPILKLALSLIEGSEAVESAAKDYFSIRIWAAPASLIHLVILGYLLGQQRSNAILGLQLLLNGTNIALDFLFVVGFGWGVNGVAAATAIAELLAATFGLVLVFRHLRVNYQKDLISLAQLMELRAIRRTMAVNRDIMIRTLSLIFALAWFTNEGAARGDVLLASNAILMQFVTFSAFFLDGYALAGESFTGRAIGKKQPRELELTIRYISELGFATAIILTMGIIMLGPIFIELLTTAQIVRETSQIYLVWAAVTPVISVWCFLLDGIFIGATCTREMRNAMIASLVVYLAAFYLLTPHLNNHGLWLSLMIYYVARALTLFPYLNNVRCLAQTED